MKKYFLLPLLFVALSASAQHNYKLVKDIPYVSSSEADAYRKERCKLDIYYPENKKDFPVVVWFHGGGLTGGSKDLPEELMEKGFAVVTANYRLSPKATAPAYIEDAAEAIAWAFKNMKQYGADTDKIVVSGHSAGGYLAMLIGFDKSYLAKHNIDADKVAAWMPLSGQMVTHYTIRAERGLPDGIPVIDKYAPTNNARKDTPPVYLITGDRTKELAARYEENAHLAAVLKSIGHENTYLYELQGFDHGTMRGPGCYLIVEYIQRNLLK